MKTAYNGLINKQKTSVIEQTLSAAAETYTIFPPIPWTIIKAHKIVGKVRLEPTAFANKCILDERIISLHENEQKFKYEN